MGADAVEVADAGAVVGGRTARVLEPAVLDEAVVDADPVGYARRIGFDELRAGVNQPDAINVRRLRARIENDFVVPGVADRQVSDGRVGAVGPDAERNAAVVGIVHAFAAEDDLGAASRAANRNIVPAIDVK